MPNVSVIVPNYNHAKFLPLRLESIFNQTYQDFEVILLDDYSNDNSAEILEEYAKNPKVSHFKINKQNSGSTFKQWARGAELVKGKYIWIAESDDYCDSKFLENAVAKLELNTDIGLVFCQSWKVNESNTIIDSCFNWTKDLESELFKSDFTYKGINFIDDFLIHRNVIPNASAVVFRKVDYDKVDGVNQNIKYCGDWFLWLKILTVSQVAFIAESLNYFRYHEDSVIYKATHAVTARKSYSDTYDKKMRMKFYKWLKHQKVNFSNILLKNRLYVSKGLASQALWHLEKGQIFTAIYFGFRNYLLIKDFQLIKFTLKKILIKFLGAGTLSKLRKLLF